MKRTVSGLLARLWRRQELSAAEVRALRPGRILIVRQHNQMGDMVCATPALRAIRRQYPDAEIGLVCAPVNRDVVLHNPDLDRVFVFAKRDCTRPVPLLRFIGELRNFAPELAFVLSSVSWSVTSAALAAASGAAVIVGGDSRPFGFDISRHAFSLVMPSMPDIDRHAVDHNLAPLAAIGFETDDSTTVVASSPQETARAEELRRDVPGEGRLWVMHPGAGKAANLWPADRFAVIAARVVAAGKPLLVLQGPADGEVMARFRDAGRRLLDPHALAQVVELPPTSLGVCAALLSVADRFLCNDTGLMHVAGAVGVPTLALFGPTDPRLWAPRAATLSHLRGAGGRLEALSTDTIWDRWRTLPPRPGTT
ncbi:glycosyltransferase family 9 protein [bacterium]|nr:glycosyltransferase family 9 protein [bacterium]MBU1674527.1 glycosyltransferase family 9 protein [bacterium]